MARYSKYRSEEEAVADALRQDDGWSGRSDIAAAASRRYRDERVRDKLSSMRMSSQREQELRAKAIANIAWSGESATEEAIRRNMAHLAKLGY